MPNVDSIKYRSEFIPTFAQTVSLLSDRCIEEAQESGASVVFDVSDMSGDVPERGIDGNLARLNSNDTQIPCVLKEYGGVFRITDFERFKSQSNERDKMYRKITGRVNRRLDRVLISELNQSTTVWNTGTAITVNIATVNSIIAELGNLQAEVNPQMVTWVVTPKMNGKLMELNQFTSADFVNAKPYEAGANQFENRPKLKSWAEVAWLVSPLLPGVGTATATTFLFHRNAIGCSKPSSQINIEQDRNREHQYEFCSATVKAAAKVLQTGGIIKVTHNDTA